LIATYDITKRAAAITAAARFIDNQYVFLLRASP